MSLVALGIGAEEQQQPRDVVRTRQRHPPADARPGLFGNHRGADVQLPGPAGSGVSVPRQAMRAAASAAAAAAARRPSRRAAAAAIRRAKAKLTGSRR